MRQLKKHSSKQNNRVRQHFRLLGAIGVVIVRNYISVVVKPKPKNPSIYAIFRAIKMTQCGQECGQKFPPKAKKSLETLGFQGFVLVEISGIEPLTS